MSAGYVGILIAELRFPGSGSLKDKRQVIKSIKDRLHNHFNVSVAEVEELDSCQLAVVGIAMVSNDAHHLKKALGQIVEALRTHPVAELIAHEMEV